MSKFILTKKAVEDLSMIWHYSYKVWSENQADKYYEMLIDTCQELSKSPSLGKKYNEISEQVLGFRIGKHIIFYQLINSKEIHVIRVLHEEMDYSRQLAVDSKQK